MASNVLKLHIPSLKINTPLPPPVPHRRTVFPTLTYPGNQTKHGVSTCHSFHRKEPRLLSLSIRSSLSSPAPPSSKEEAIQQARTCLSTTLEKALNNPILAGKMKKLKQPRFQVEIPFADDSPASQSRVALDVFRDLPIRRKGSQVKTLILWPKYEMKIRASEAFQVHSSSSNVEHADIGAVANAEDYGVLGSADIAVFLAPESTELSAIKAVCDRFYAKPVVMFNPGWAIQEEAGLGQFDAFARSFEVIYSLTGLEVQGLMSKRTGMVFRCVRDGVVSGEKWHVLVEEEGELKLVSSFKTRPSIREVENVLYNLMAINSPITKSAKFIRELVSNVTGRK